MTLKKSYAVHTKLCGNSSVVEHNLAKVGVASSNLVSRSNFKLVIDQKFIEILSKRPNGRDHAVAGIESRFPLQFQVSH